MGKKLLFIGAGAIGSYLGAFLSRAGHAVTLVDPWAEQVDTINRQGIAVTGPHDPFTARPAAGFTGTFHTSQLSYSSTAELSFAQPRGGIGGGYRLL